MNSEFENYINYIEAFHDFGAETVKLKCIDYAGTDEPLRNFRDAALLAGVTVEQGLLVRMADKIARVRTLSSKRSSVGEVGEKLEDTLMDLSNYAAILSYYCKTTYPEVEDKQLGLFEDKVDEDIPTIDLTNNGVTYVDLGEKLPQETIESLAQNQTWYEKIFGTKTI